MKYEFSYYREEDFGEVENLILNSYEWDIPVYGVSRMEFSRGLHPAYLRREGNWTNRAGIYRKDGKIVACVINEALYENDAFFLFDTKERSMDKELVERMFKHASTHMGAFDETNNSWSVEVRVPLWNDVMKQTALDLGYKKTVWTETTYILTFGEQPFDVAVPEGYRIADGNETPASYLANVHCHAFWYGHPCAETGEKAFHGIRQMPHYKKELDLCMLDPEGKPVGMANIWYDERMPYCELEPLGVVYWERRKGIASALIHEAANRVRKYGNCKGMTGGDQQFYFDLGFELKGNCDVYRLETKMKQSWM